MATHEIASPTPRMTPPPRQAKEDASDADFVALWIEPDPSKPWPGDARVRDYFIHVWALIGHQRATGATLQSLARDYGLPLQAAAAAIAYYEHHRHAIDVRLDENDA